MEWDTKPIKYKSFIDIYGLTVDVENHVWIVLALWLDEG